MTVSIIVNGAGYESWLANVSLPASRIVDTTAAVGDRLLAFAQPLRHQRDALLAGASRAAESRGIGEVIAALSPRRTDVLVYVRRQDRLLESMYMQQIHLGKSLTWEDFFANAGGDDRVRYRDLMEVIEGLPVMAGASA